MSRITFLDNASLGENNIWRYLLTIILTWGSAVIFEILILILVMVYFLSQGFDSGYFLEIILNNPLIILALLGVTYVISLIFLYVGVRYIHQRKFITLINTDFQFSWRRLLKGGAIWIIILTIGTVLTLLFEPGSLKITFNISGFSILLILSLLVFPIQASFEELFFRGYLMQGFGLLSKKPVLPLIMTSVIFAILHYFNAGTTLISIDMILQAFIIGIMLGIITLGENRLETAMGVHIANNMFVCLIANNPIGFTQDLPSLLTYTASPDPLIDSIGISIYAIVLLVIIFWGKKKE
ncbi:MAG: CPBP family intramembrane metalloprotease [Methanobacterium sp.]|nr:CPBP family intramembrane metalloprotease [Methanobacterium sp.]